MTKEKYDKIAKFMWVHEDGNGLFTYKFRKDQPSPSYRTPTFKEAIYINFMMMKRARVNIYENRGIF